MKCSCEVEKLNSEDSILAVDVGGGTQDILLYNPHRAMENNFKLILPSQSVIVSQKIKKATKMRKDILLTGYLMGGGASTKAIINHLKSGLKVYAENEAAKSIHDNLERVTSLGVILNGDIPDEITKIEMKDVHLENLSYILEKFSLTLPKRYLIAVQDHGESPNESNRNFRFQIIKRFLQEDGRIKNLIYKEIPPHFTRMLSVKKYIPEAILMDTGFAAVYGALTDPMVEKKIEEGILIVNIGNQHTLGVLLKEMRILGVFEEHTKNMNKKILRETLDRFLQNNLTHEEIFDRGGHGCYISPSYSRSEGYRLIAITGPRREIAKNLGYYFSNPYGDMMLIGCYGLLRAAKDNNFL